MDGFPVAIYLASEESVFHNQGVLFHLVKPTKKGDGVESAAGLVNVVPRKRIYRMETPEELEIFKNELLKRPLVLQPSVYHGKGLGEGNLGCGLCIEKANWVLFINQTHPKILGRIQMGVDAALKTMEKGIPFLLRYKFDKLMERLHYQVFQDNPGDPDIFLYSNWENGELIVRYPGAPSESKKLMQKPKMVDIQFGFEDMTPLEVSIKQPLPYALPRPTNNPVTGDEIRTHLPDWTVNEITPLENIGETAPAANYSYAQAGRLYESFRKKKKHRPKQGTDNEIELDEISPSVSRRQEATPQLTTHSSSPRPLRNPPDNGAYSPRTPHDLGAQNFHGHSAQAYPPQNSHSGSSYPPQNSQVHGKSAGYIMPHGQYQELPRNRNRLDDHGEKRPDHSSLYPDVQIVNKSKEWYNTPNPEDSYNQLHVSGRESNQSSFSTATSSGPPDSGYHGNESDSNSSDRHYHDNMHSNKPQTKPRHLGPQENLAFAHEHDNEDIMRKHREYVNRMLQQEGALNNNDTGARAKEYPVKPKRRQHMNTQPIQNGHSNYRNPDHSYGYNQPNSYKQNIQESSEAMSESFI